MKNTDVSDIFYGMSDLLSIKNVPWKARAYNRAARTIGSFPENLETLYKAQGVEGLKNISGVGEAIAKKIIEYLKTGKIKSYISLKKSVPKYILLLLNIPGLGPKKVKKLNDVLKINSLLELKKAAEKHLIAKIPGFGLKSEKDIFENLSFAKQNVPEKISLKEAEKISSRIIKLLKKLPEIEKIEIAGSVRRRKPLIGDLDFIVLSSKTEKVLAAFISMKEVSKILAKGSAKASVLLKSGRQADIRVFPSEEWGAGLLYFTGSKNYNIHLRRIAMKKGYKLNEYGLFEKETGKKIAGKTEEEILGKLGEKFLRPEEREF